MAEVTKMLETKSTEFNLNNLLKDLPKQIEKIRELRKLVLNDAVLLGEIPSPKDRKSVV